MKSVCIVPIKSESERVKKKNFHLLNGVPLYKHFLNKLKCCDFDEVYIDTDSKEINEFVQDMGFKDGLDCDAVMAAANKYSSIWGADKVYYFGGL